jgi:hypothetical protein
MGWQRGDRQARLPTEQIKKGLLKIQQAIQSTIIEGYNY